MAMLSIDSTASKAISGRGGAVVFDIADLPFVPVAGVNVAILAMPDDRAGKAV